MLYQETKATLTPEADRPEPGDTPDHEDPRPEPEN